MNYVIISKSICYSLITIINFNFNLNNSNEVKTEEKFYEHQENFKKINKMIENFEETLYNKVLFYINSWNKIHNKR